MFCFFLTDVLLKCRIILLYCTTDPHPCCLNTWKHCCCWTCYNWFVAVSFFFLEHQALWAAQLQRARHDGGQRSVLVWLLRESLAVSTKRPGGQSPGHYPWVHLSLFKPSTGLMCSLEDLDWVSSNKIKLKSAVVSRRQNQLSSPLGGSPHACTGLNLRFYSVFLFFYPI